MEDRDRNTSRVDALDMIIKTARFFPTNVYNDMYTDVVGHEWYAGCVEAAYQNGIIIPEMVEDGRFLPEKEVSMEEFLVFAINGYASRKKLPEEEPCVYDEKCSEYAKRYIRMAYVLGLRAKDGTENLSRIITRGEAVNICRSMNI